MAVPPNAPEVLVRHLALLDDKERYPDREEAAKLIQRVQREWLMFEQPCAFTLPGISQVEHASDGSRHRAYIDCQQRRG